MSELKNGVMLIENALRCVAQDIELYYKKKAPNGAWCIATCRNAAAQFEQMRSELAELRRAQPENEPLTLEELRQMDGEPVFAVDGEGHSAWVVVNAKGECCADNEFGSWAFSYYEMMMPTVLTESENKLHPMGWLACRRNPERSEGK